MPYITFEYYHDEYKGGLNMAEFALLVNETCDLIKLYCERYIAPWKFKDNLEDYEMDLKRAICYQIDYVERNGGISVFDGNSDADVESVTTSGYTVKMSKDVEKFEGIPMSPMAKSMIMGELRKKEYLSRLVK